MTLEDWTGSLSASELHHKLCNLPGRKLHLLTAALLRRVWDDLPSDHTRIAVEATEKFADGGVTADELARLRSTDLLDSCEGLWLNNENYAFEGQLIGLGWDCSCCTPYLPEYECRSAKKGYMLDGVRAAVNDPAWMVVRAALLAREIVTWKANGENRSEAEQEESRAQFSLLREIAGPDWTNPHWPQWRTTDVLALARGIYRNQAYDRLPILADALQDAGCDDAIVLSHCREAKEHARGCWIVDLAMGIA